MASELGQQTVDLSTLISRLAEDSFLNIKELVHKSKSPELSDADRKLGLLKFINRTQQRMLRAYVVAKWCRHVPLLQYCQQLVSTLSSHDACFTQAADSLFFMHEALQQARAPFYDVPSALEVFLTGSYQRLPKCIEDIGTQGTLNETEQKPVLKKLDILLRSKLLEISRPKEMSVVNISEGTALLKVEGEFQVLVTLGYRGHLSMWRILHLELLVGEKSGPVKLEESRRHLLGDDLERRMAAAENPFMTLFLVLHELCVALIMDTVIRQVQALRQGRWKDAIRFELISDGSCSSTQVNQDGETDSAGLRIPGLKLVYWLDLDKNPGVSDAGSCPFVKIEPGQDLRIKCIHSTFSIDPLLGQEAEFSLDLSCIDVESLLLKAICCNRYTRLLEIQKELEKNVHICRAPNEVLLQSHMDAPGADYKKTDLKSQVTEFQGQDVLYVHAYGSSYFTLGINIRNGRFLLQSTQNILAPSELLECEEALNQGSRNAADVFTSLRSKSVLHLFASIGRFLGLEVHEQVSASVKIPKTLSNGSAMLLMGFPDCGSSYFLLMQLDKDFKPLFKLLATQPDPSGTAQFPNDLNLVLRNIEIDIGQMQVFRDLLNMSILDSEKISSHLTSTGVPNQSLEIGVLPEVSIKNDMQITGCPASTFSSIVDEVFELGCPHAIKTGSLDDNDPLSVSKPSRLLSPPIMTGSRVPAPAAKSNGPRSSLTGHLAGPLKSTVLSPPASTPLCKIPSPGDASYSASRDVVSRHDKSSQRHTISDILKHIPALEDLEADSQFAKKRKITKSAPFGQSSSEACREADMISNTEGYSYGNLILEENKGNGPCSIYVSALLHVVRHCSLCIKHARLTRQMKALDISYVEEVSTRDAYINIWFPLPFSRSRRNSWQHLCLRLGRPGSMSWDVKIKDQHFRDLWDLQKGSSKTPWGSGVSIANISNLDSHIRYDPEGVILSYQSVEPDSIKNLLADIQRLSNARMFALGMRKLLGVKTDEKPEECSAASDVKVPSGGKTPAKAADKLSEQMRKAFKIEAVGLMSLWFSFGSGPLARFVVEWESEKEGCTMHVCPDQLWPHTKFLEDFINGGEVASLLDCIRLTAGPLHALAAATRPARASPAPGVPTMAAAASTAAIAGPNLINAPLVRGGPGIVPSSLLPIDVSVVLRGPYWIRIIYRKHFAVDMRCFAGDQVWLQPATPPKGGPSVGGSLPCPQFRPFIMEHVAQELNGLDANFPGGQQAMGLTNANNPNTGSGAQLSNANGTRVNLPSSASMPRTAANQVAGLTRVGNGLPGSPNLAVRRPPVGGFPAQVRGELNTAIIGLGDDGGYGGGWVPLVALKKVLRGILKYLGVLWLFAQLPDLLKDILGSILKDNEGALLNLDQEQPALRFFVGGYVFAVSVHRVQLLLQVLSVKRFHHQQQQQQQQPNSTAAQEELTKSEIDEICDYFSRRVASEPYDASRVASFITLLTLPISVLREFLKLIAWKKGLTQGQGGVDVTTPAQKSRIELCLENHSGLNLDESSANSSSAKSNIHYNRPHNSVDFALTVVLDPAHIPHMNAAGGAAWLPYCVFVRLRYSFSENPNVSFLGMEASHGGRACWLRVDDWEKCKQRVARTVEVNGSSTGDITQGKLRIVADTVQRTLHLCLQGLRDGAGAGITASSVPT
ncbi:mediator of RNA polymerase II transcription subunit 14-like [Rutidosis leptorrhynchoides]|uniref:mediator of RNA polymerase II transcription subunit 14-like n=1 Tax=Rutidosis leptorrhynchoides TaxID=125765 RepID=UPI003A98FC38